MKTEPMTLDEVAGQTAFVADAKRWQEKGEYPAALLVYGPPGIGKTTVGKVLARASLGEFYDPANFIITNASDDRGIDFIRNHLKHWASVKALGAKRRVILLDEADGLTPAAQDALRQIIEMLSDNCFFILTANDISKIRPAIKSRCVTYEFKPITSEQALTRLVQLKGQDLVSKNPKEWGDAAHAVMHVTGGDLRAAVAIWQMSDDPEYFLTMARECTDNHAALAAVGGEWMDMRATLYEMLDRGQTLTQVMRSFHQNLTSFFELDPDNTFAVMAVLGEMVPHMYEWPIGSYSFVDCLVARLKKEVSTYE